MTLYGMDISRYQAGLDFANVPADLVVVYVTGGRSVENPVWRQQVDNALAHGKRVLAYHFAHDDGFNAWQDELNHFLATLGDYANRVDGMVLDWESRWAAQTGWARTWIAEARRRTGKTVWLYAYYALLTSGADFSGIHADGVPLWEAAYVAGENRIYGYQPPAGRLPIPWWGDPQMWQFTSAGYLPGWDGRLDLNVYFGTADDWANLHATTIRPAGTVTPQEDELSAEDIEKINAKLDNISGILLYGYKSGGVQHPGVAMVAEENQRRIASLPARVWGWMVNRGNKQVPAIQELADIKSKVLDLEPAVAEIQANTDPATLAALIPDALAQQVIDKLSARLAGKAE